MIQNIVESEFARGLDEYRATRIFGVVMDAHSGELLALVQTGGLIRTKLNFKPRII